MANYVCKRGGKYCFRRPVPASLQARFDGAKQWMFSLRTSAEKTAHRLANIERVRTDALLIDAEASPKMAEDGAIRLNPDVSGLRATLGWGCQQSAS